MTIKIEVEHEGEIVFRAENSLVESAVQELYRFERHVLPTLEHEA